MIATANNEEVAAGKIQLATFYVGELLFGLKIDQVQEINRRLDVTRVPHAVPAVRGVINLRGEVVTVVDLRTVLGLDDGEASTQCRNVIVSHNDELVGLCVDRIADILTISVDDVNSTPSNVNEVDSRFFHGVVPLEEEIVIVLNLATVLEIA